MPFKMFGMAALTSLSNTLSYIKFLFSEWLIRRDLDCFSLRVHKKFDKRNTIGQRQHDVHQKFL